MNKDTYIQDSFNEWGYSNGFRPMKDKILVRTHPLPETTTSGLIYLPPKLSSFHGELPNLQPIVATALSVGKDVLDIKVGDTLCFMRLNFTWLHKCEDGTYIGLIQEPNVIGNTDGDIRLTMLH